MWTNERSRQTKKESLSHVGQSTGRDGGRRRDVRERASVENVFIRNTSVSNFLLGFRRSELHVYSNTLSLSVGYYTLFTFLPFFTLKHTHKHKKIFFGSFSSFSLSLSLSPVQDTPIFTCAFVEPAHLTIIPLLGSLFECVLCMLQTESAFFLLPFVCSTQAISSSNSSSNLVK